MDARPTTDFAKEGLFNVLHHSVPLANRVLDLFAGTGNISLEFLSRGAEEVVSVESDRRLCDHMQRSARDLGEEHWRVVKADVPWFPAHTPRPVRYRLRVNSRPSPWTALNVSLPWYWKRAYWGRVER